MDNESDNLIKKTVNDLKKIKGVIGIILFGSYARGNEKKISDIDLSIIVEKNFI